MLVNPNTKNRFVHLTVDQKWVEPQTYGRRSGLHTDSGLKDDEGNQVDITAENSKYIAKKHGITDHAYIYSNVLPTEFFPGPFPLSVGNLKSFEEMAQGQNPITYPNNTMLRLAFPDIHGSVRNETGKPVYRTFFKIQFTEELLDRKINTINPDFDYDLARETSNKKPGETDKATLSKGGIDLTTANMNLQMQNTGGAIKLHLDPAMIQQLQNAPGFVPLIIKIQPMTDLRLFLGLEKNPSTRAL